MVSTAPPPLLDAAGDTRRSSPSPRMKHSRAIAAIRELCSLGLGGELLIPALLEALHDVIPSSRNLFDWIDDVGHIERYYFEGPIDHRIAKLYFDEFYNRRESEAMPRFSELARSGTVIHGAQALNSASFFNSALYHEIWHPQGLHYHLEAVIRRTDGKALGSLVLYREKTDPIFTREDEERLATLVPYIARAMQSGRNKAEQFAAGEARTALVNLDHRGDLLYSSSNAHSMLLLAHGDITPASARVEPTVQDFATLTLLYAALMRSPGADKPVTVTLDNAWGRFEFEARKLQAAGAGQRAIVALTIRHLVASEVAQARALKRSPLSVQQRRVCSLLLNGRSQTQVAADLGVAPSTVVDHLRKVYRRLDVHSVAELRARLLGS